VLKNIRYPKLLSLALFFSIVLLSPYFFLFSKGISGQAVEWSHIWNTLFWTYLWDTLSILLSVGLLSLIWGVLPAYLISRFDFPGSKFFSWALAGPLAIPTFIMAIIYSGITDVSGPLSVFVNFISDREKPFYLDILNFWGLSFTLSFALYPYVYLSSLIAFRSKTRSFEEAALSLGSSPIKVFKKVTLPLALPFILSGLLLVLMEVLNNYGAMKYYGQNTFTIGIFKAWFDLNDLNSAIYIGAFLFIFVLLLLWLRRKTEMQSVKVEVKQWKKVKLNGTKKLLSFLFCSLLFLFAFLIPASFIFYQGVYTFPKVVDSDFTRIILYSILICLIAAMIIVFISVLFSESKRWTKMKYLNTLLEFNNIGYAIPGAIIAIGLVALAKIFNINSGMIALSFFILILGFCVRFLSSGFQSLNNALQDKSTKQDEAAQLLGASAFSVFKRIHLPQLKLPILIAFLFVFIEVIKELPLTLILKPFNFESLATVTFQYAKDEMLSYSCVPAMFILLITIFPNFLIHRYLNK